MTTETKKTTPTMAAALHEPTRPSDFPEPSSGLARQAASVDAADCAGYVPPRAGAIETRGRRSFVRWFTGVFAACALVLALAASPALATGATVASELAVPVSTTSENLTAQINPNGLDTTYHFEYGTGDCASSACTTVPVPDVDIGSETSDQFVTQTTTGLSANTTYHFRVVASNSAGTTDGTDQTFTTMAGLSFLPGAAGFDGSVTNQDGSPDTQAGSHPYAASTTFTFTTATDSQGGEVPDGNVKDVQAELPPGFAGDPQAIPECPPQDLTIAVDNCPGASQVGVDTVLSTNGTTIGTFPVYNMVPPAGVPAQFEFIPGPPPVFLDASVRTGGDYGLRISVNDISQQEPVIGSSLTFWGVPADPSHDAQRTCPGSVSPCSADATPAPFLTLPTSCAGPQTTTIRADSWQDPGHFITDSFVSHDNSGNPIGADGCNQLSFSPTITVQPDTTSADSPTGLHVDLHIPQNENPEGLAEADLKDAVVTLPEGMVVNPSSADGLAGCTSAQIELHGPEPAQCPNASKIGSVEVDTPLLEHPLPGSVYLAAQGDNPFRSLLAIYIAVHDPQSGVVVKLAGHVEANPVTGQLKTTFEESPQLPFEDFKLDFFGGPRAPLTTPVTCGEKTTTTDLTPWTSPEGKDAFPSSAFDLTSGPNGSACVNTEAEQPNQPSFEAGTTIPIAGSYSPFVLKLSREPGSQVLKALNATLPPGLSGRLAGTPYCSDAQIAAAAQKSGSAEKSSPSCPLASEVGTVNVGAGSGAPFYVQGRAYLAGPYKGAPLSLEIITPAVAGPFDLGTVAVRTALYVNEYTAQIHAVSDPLPSILAGIPLDVRSIALNMNRPQFTLNPTSCNPMAVLGSATSTLGQAASLSDRFQVGACGALGFKPKLKLSLKGGTKRHRFPSLKAVVTYPQKGSYTNIAKAQITLPHSAFLEQGHIKTVCTRPELASQTCPAASIYGHATAVTPLLDKPLSGPVYLGVGFGHKLPDLVADLNGQIRVLLDGKVDTGKEDGLRNTFLMVPDAPVSKFTLEMFGGKKGLIVNSENLCRPKAKVHAVADFTAHNGKTYDTNPKVANSCAKKGKKTSKRVGTSHR